MSAALSVFARHPGKARALAVLIATLPLAMPQAWADTTPPSTDQAASKSDQTVETITVTARRRVESAQDVPAPVSVLRGKDLAQEHIYQGQDLQQLLPSVNTAFNHARQSSVAVRGIGNNPANEGLESSVGIVVDNVYYGRPGMAVFDLLDVSQIDLLRGPQGTLFGKNTTAGVLNISTQKPSFVPTGEIDTSLANRNYQQYHASVTGPLTDTVAASFTAYKTHDDGWLTNLYNGQKLDGIDRTGARAQVRWEPNENFSLRVIGDYNDEDSSTGTLVPYGFGPVAPGKLTFLQLVTKADATNVPTNPANYDVNVNGPQEVTVHQGGVSAEANWILANDYRLTSITAGREWLFRPHNDIDFSNIAGVNDNGANVDDRQFSQELRLASPAGGRFDYVAGLFYFYQNAKNTVFTDYGPLADVVYATPAGRFANVTSLTHGEATTNSAAAFGQSTWHIDPQLDLTAGARLTWEDKTARTYRDAPIGGTALTQAALGAWDSGELSNTSVSPSGLLNLAYRFDKQVLGYVSVSHGEKSGGYNINGVGSGPTLGADSLRVGAERANDAELGVKSQWLDGRLLINADIFIARINGYQTSTYLYNPATGTPVAAMTNAGSVDTRGAEFEVRAVPLQGLSLDFNGAYNNATYASFTQAPCPAEQSAAGAVTCDLTGKPLNGAPKWMFNLQGEYHWNVFDAVQQYVAANYAWRSGAYGDLSDSSYSWIGSYALVNLATGWRGKTAQANWEVSVWAKNLFDKRYYLSAGSQAIGGGLYAASAGQPRTVGVTGKLGF